MNQDPGLGSLQQELQQVWPAWDTSFSQALVIGHGELVKSQGFHTQQREGTKRKVEAQYLTQAFAEMLTDGHSLPCLFLSFEDSGSGGGYTQQNGTDPSFHRELPQAESVPTASKQGFSQSDLLLNWVYQCCF